MKILCGIPNMGTIPTRTAISLQKLAKAFNREMEFMYVANSLVYVAREMIIERAEKEGFDAVLFIDSDMEFEPEDVMKLFEPSFGIVSGLYYTRFDPLRPVAYSEVVKRSRVEAPRLKQIVVDKTVTLQKVQAVGMGFILIKRAAWQLILKKYKNCFDPKWGCGEDIAFCIKAENCGLGIWVRTDTNLGHIGEKVYRDES